MKTLISLLALAMLTASTFASDGPIRHVVHFKFKSDATPEQIKEITNEFAALKPQIDVIESLEWGTDVSPEGLSKGFTHCWIVSFKNAADRDAYLVHPAHKAFVEVLKPILDEALVVDFVPEK
ncbi:MAG TPA: Dabb family protein [Chthoniobacteraceae bacterium]|nr:Dabb family protein [Chthoniobacteraceae bacterium]